jgi:hypothetical protein
MVEAGGKIMEQIKKNKKSSDTTNGKVILVHNEMIAILERLRKQITEFGWEALDITWVDLTKVLARKINSAGVIK